MQSGLVKNMLGACSYCHISFQKREQKRKFCSLSCASRFNQNGVKTVVLPRRNKKLAEFVGICLGDGCTSDYQVSVTLNSVADKEYVLYVKKLAACLFPGATISLVKRKDTAIDVRIFSHKVVSFMREMGIISKAKFIPQWIKNDSAYRRACIRGLLDTEGSISFKEYPSKRGISLYKQLNFRSISGDFMKFVRDELLLVGLKPTMTLKKSLYLSNHKSIDRYRKLIGFSNPKLYKRSKIRDYSHYIVYLDSVPSFKLQ